MNLLDFWLYDESWLRAKARAAQDFLDELKACEERGLGDCPNCDTALVEVKDGKCEFCAGKSKYE